MHPMMRTRKSARTASRFSVRRARRTTSSKRRKGGCIRKRRGGEPDIQATLNMMQAAGVPLERRANSYRLSEVVTARRHRHCRCLEQHPGQRASEVQEAINTGSPTLIIPSRLTSALSANLPSNRRTMSLSTRGFTSSVSGSIVVM